MRKRLIPVSAGKTLKDIQMMHCILGEAGEVYVSL